jgi:Xaa-Pro dipeptidase
LRADEEGAFCLSRVDQLQQAMAEIGVEAMFLRLPENVMVATGWWVQIPGLGIALVPRAGEASLLIPEYEVPEARTYWGGDIRAFPAIRFDGPLPATEIPRLLRTLAAEHGLAGAPMGYEGSFEAVAPPQIDGEPSTVARPTIDLIRSAFETEELVDVTSALEELKALKTEHDLERLRITNEIASFGLEAFKEHAVAGRTEAEIAAEVGRAITAKGHGYRSTRVVRCYPTVWSGPETAGGWQYFRSRDRRVEPDDVVMLELGTAADGYWADHTRTVVAGRATDRQREAMAAVFEAQRAAFEAARPGSTGGEVDAASRAACAAAGFEQFPHHTGHGVGFRYHEALPWITKGSEHVVRETMVIVAEPGIYEEGLGGFRWEDNAVVTDSGAVRLAHTDYGLD